jgi:hypothetical protein
MITADLRAPPRRWKGRSVRWVRRSCSVAAILYLGLVTPATPASAQEDVLDTDDQVVVTGRLIVPEGETVQTAVILQRERADRRDGGRDARRVQRANRDHRNGR